MTQESRSLGAIAFLSKLSPFPSNAETKHAVNFKDGTAMIRLTKASFEP